MKRRKKAKERKSFTFNLRLSQDERARLNALAKEWQVSAANCVRILIARNSEREKAAGAELAKVSERCNSLAGSGALCAQEIERITGDLRRVYGTLVSNSANVEWGGWKLPGTARPGQNGKANQ